VDHPSDELLAGSALAREEHGRLRGSDSADQIQNPPRGGRVSDEQPAGGGSSGLVEETTVLLLQPLPLARQLLQVAPVLDREAAQSRERGEEALVFGVERRASAAAFLVGQNEHAEGTSAAADRHTDRRGDGDPQKSKPFPASRAFRSKELLQEIVFGDGRLGETPREAHSSLCVPGTPLAERREVSARGVENPDRATQDVLRESLLVRE